jgi:protein-S-isoprenylcysteine O-methyltransferase Ste14
METSHRVPVTVLPPRGMRRVGVACGHFLFGYRDYLFTSVVVLLVMTTTPGEPFGSRRLDHGLDALGFVVALLGQSCRLLAFGSVENIRRRGDNKRIAAQALIRDGIFAHTRNPLYLGNWLIVCGLVLIANNRWWYLLVLPGFTAAYWLMVLAEEDFLRGRFGPDYEAYAAKVNRFVPDRRGFFRVLISPGFAWRRAIRKEARVACNWVAAALVLIAWERWTHKGATWPVLIGLPILALMGRIPIRDRTPAPAAARSRPPDPPERSHRSAA